MLPLGRAAVGREREKMGEGGDRVPLRNEIRRLGAGQRNPTCLLSLELFSKGKPIFLEEAP